MKEEVKEKVVYRDIFLKNEPRRNKYSFLTPLFFSLFAAFVLWMYSVNKGKWERAVEVKNQEIENLQLQISQIQQQYKVNDEAETATMKSMSFDAYDVNFYRVYGLFRDEKKALSVNQIAESFNIYNPRAVEMREVMGERWFIVPVKGTHFYKNDEDLEGIAAKYYDDKKAGLSLIKKFNKNIKKGNFIFLPFQ